jgi:hypothetical protein
MQCRVFIASLVITLTMAFPTSWVAADSGRRFIFFDSSSSELTERARESVAGFIAVWNGKCPLNVFLDGHVDAAEARTASVNLDIERAHAVAEQFKRLGTPAWTFEITGWGNSRALVPTRLGVSEPQSRRVELQFRRLPVSGRLECEPGMPPQVDGVPSPECNVILTDGVRCPPW